MIRKILFQVFIFFLAAVSVQAEYQIVLQAGHDGAVNTMEYQARERVLITSGEDNRLIITDSVRGKVLRRFHVTEGRILNVKTNPVTEQVSVISRKDKGYTLSVWNWKKQTKDYSIEFQSEPVFAIWSARGRYLLIGKIELPSLTIVDARNGRILPYLKKLSSIYNAGYIGSTENILMLYSVNGDISYWNLRTSELKLSAPSLPNLKGIQVIQTSGKKYIFAYRDNTLFAINRSTGAVSDQVDIPGFLDASVDIITGDVDALSRSLLGTFLYQYTIKNGIFQPRLTVETISKELKKEEEDGDVEEENSEEPAPPTLTVDSLLNPIRVLRRKGTTYLATGNGEILSESEDQFKLVFQNNLWKIDSFAFGEGTAYLSGEGALMKYESPFFKSNASPRIELFEELKYSQLLSKPKSLFGIEVGLNETVLLWDKSALEEGLRVLQPGGRSILGTTAIRTDQEIERVKVIDSSRVLTVGKNGSVAIVDLISGKTVSRFNALGVMDAGFAPFRGGYVLVGRTSSSSNDSAMERFDVRTGELIPVSDRRFMVYRVKTGKNGFYTIGVSRSNSGTPVTSLMEHDFSSPERKKTIYSQPGEDLNAQIVLSQKGALFTTMGGRVSRFFRGFQSSFAWILPVKEIKVHGDILYGLDSDGTLVLWNANNRRLLFSVSLFDGGGWIALSSDRKTLWWSSQKMLKNVVVYQNGREVNPTRLSIP